MILRLSGFLLTKSHEALLVYLFPLRVFTTPIINAPLEKVWKVTAIDFDKVDEWSSGVSASGIADGDAPTDEAEMGGRFCMTAYGKCFEMFESFDEAAHTFTYKAQFENTIPGVKRASNTWRLEAISDAQTRFSMTSQTELNVFPGLLMRIPFRFQIPRVLNMNLEEAKHFIETGKPHPRKVEAMQKVTNSVSSPSTI